MTDLLDALLKTAEDSGASDLMLHEGRPAVFKVSGELSRAEMPPLEPPLFDELWKICRAGDAGADHDASLQSPRGVRFRVNLFYQLGRRGAVLRRINTEVPAMADLGLPDTLLQSWLQRSSGLILVCGPTGSGKSTTLASALEWINQHHSKHIITIEDPVEYLFKQEQSLVTQREVGIDVPAFSEGLRRALRQAPDVILVGEIRDRETASIALQASETGHLVLSTLHVSRASEAVERFSLMFNQDERDSVCAVLSRELIGVFVQRLVPAVDGGVCLANEYFTNLGATTDLVASRKVEELADVLRKPTTHEACGFNHSLVALTQAGKITEEAARSASPEPGDLTRALRGIR